MKELTTDEKLKIANAGGFFQETGQSSWVGTPIRKGSLMGKVTQDLNGALRILTVWFEDGTQEVIRMNNLGEDEDYIHAYEFLSVAGRWLRL